MQTRHAEVESSHITAINIQYWENMNTAYNPRQDLKVETKTHTYRLHTQILPSILPGVPSMGQNKSRGVKRGSIRGKRLESVSLEAWKTGL